MPEIRAERRGSTLVISADGPVVRSGHATDLGGALAAWADDLAGRMRRAPIRSAPTI